MTSELVSVQLQALEGEVQRHEQALLTATTPAEYQAWLIRIYGFVAPLERSLAGSTAVLQYIDPRRFERHLLLEDDLRSLGLKRDHVTSLPQCRAIPRFDDAARALGWAYVVESSKQVYPALFRYLASVLPGEAAFAASYLKAYPGNHSATWRTLCRAIDVACAEPSGFDGVLAGARQGFGSYLRWRSLAAGSFRLPRLDERSRADTAPIPEVVEPAASITPPGVQVRRGSSPDLGSDPET